MVLKNHFLPGERCWKAGNTFETALRPSQDAAKGHIDIIHLEGSSRYEVLAFISRFTRRYHSH